MQPKIHFILPFLLVVAAAIWAAADTGNASNTAIQTEYRNNAPKTDLAPKESFDKVMDVLTHPRCMNCHPSDDIPKQGNNAHPHYFGMARGADDHGFQATQCATCHQSENNGYSGVPGAPHWALAPASMGWEGLTRAEIAKRVLDPETNGGKNHVDLIKHMTEDELVLWAWQPGVDANGNPREIPPVSEAEFKAAVEQWFASGAVIPSE